MNILHGLLSLTSLKLALLRAGVCGLSVYLLFSSLSAFATSDYRIHIDPSPKHIVRGHLDLGGENPSGETLTANSYYLEQNGKPFFPIVGEFHYARYPAALWEESILKMKAGGINVVATYVFWNLHERQEGTYDWQANLNLKRFIRLVKKHKLHAIVRIGPFCHGEIRNGGLPDWLYGRAFEVRSNDAAYLQYVDILYHQIGRQLKGLLYKDGGPVIGIQLENEYQHSAAPWELSFPGAVRENTVADRDVNVTHEGVSVSEIKNRNADYGKKHMATLKAMAKKHGMDTPLYTATGWGNAAIVDKGSLPVTAGYAYPFWSEPKASPFYLYKDIHAKPDYSPVSFDPQLYPSLPAEMGVGIVAMWKRRPLVPPVSAAPMIVRTLGSGSNGIGYYMYHGGSTPVFDHFYSEERSGAPKINYDFQAPIGEYGQIRPHHRSLNEIHLFLESFAGRLAPMKTSLPSNAATLQPRDTGTLRYALRSQGTEGFLFMHNFQDHAQTQTLKDNSVTAVFANGSVRVPQKGGFDLMPGASAILPINLTLAAVNLRYATAQPLREFTRGTAAPVYVFSAKAGIVPEFSFAYGSVIAATAAVDISTENGIITVRGGEDRIFSFTANGVGFVCIPAAMAKSAWKGPKGSLIFSSATVLTADKHIEFRARDKAKTSFHMFPADDSLKLVSNTARLEKIAPIHPQFSSFDITFSGAAPVVGLARISERKITVDISGKFDSVREVFLTIPYVGDRGLAFIDGALVADHFYYGRPWEIGLKRFEGQLKNNKMVLVFHPIYQHYPYLEDLRSVNAAPNFGSSNKHLTIQDLQVSVEYGGTIQVLN